MFSGSNEREHWSKKGQIKVMKVVTFLRYNEPTGAFNIGYSSFILKSEMKLDSEFSYSRIRHKLPVEHKIHFNWYITFKCSSE